MNACAMKCGSVMLMLALFWPAALRATALPDEIQVYTDDLTAPGKYGLELHVNTTPKGQRDPEYPGAISSHHGLRITPEFSYGTGRNTDVGLYVPAVRDAEGNWYVPGLKLRAKWMPIHGDEATGGWYLGVNGEISNISRKFSASRVSSEMRIIAGYRSEAWLIGVNPILSWALSPGHRESNPEIDMAWKVARSVVPGIALGFEYYSGMGKFGSALPRDMQDRVLYLTLDVDRAPWVFNIGIGKGQTGAADAWTVKAIVEFPFD